MVKLPLSVVILTNNEEKNLGRCLESVSGIAGEVIIVDSGSTDATRDIAKRFGAKIYKHPFTNQADQFNWALNNTKIKGEWILRLDSDERLTPELADEIKETLLEVSPKVSGFFLRRRVYFMGRWIKHGGYYPAWFLRLWRTGDGKIEDREVDEHTILLRGESRRLKNDFIDDNRKGLEEWVAKQNRYSTREARELMGLAKEEQLSARFGGEQAERKRWIKQNLYGRLPLFVRAFAYFFYRYFLRLGFLDGKEGFIFHLLQGCWYRFLVDAELYEMRGKGGASLQNL
ncbi:MAG: glycosyltransferase family 2 protein [Candidatus Jorgensenbacteria bacterium]|nr:glycosyltransferase family 2 protein [Candidatus Jorgensenbacteria bacterium]